MGDVITDLEKHLKRIGKDVQTFVEQFAEEREHDFRPDADIIDSDKQYVLLLDLPGMSKKEITISLKDQVLFITGEREFELGEEESYKRRERSTGKFARSFALPEEVDTSDIKANFKNGVLKITLPKSDVRPDSTEIPID